MRMCSASALMDRRNRIRCIGDRPPVLGLVAKHSTLGSVHFVAMDWRHMVQLLAAGQEVYGALLNLHVWAKDKGGMASLYRSGTEQEIMSAEPLGAGKDRHKGVITLRVPCHFAKR
jgi:hypothetical protein